MMKQFNLGEIDRSPTHLARCFQSFAESYFANTTLLAYLSTTCDMKLYHLSNYVVISLSLKETAVIVLYKITACIPLKQQ